MKRVTIYTDGGCEGNPGPGGWAAILSVRGATREISGAVPATTNNRMELQAAISALEALEEPSEVTLLTDSEYLCEGITKWVANWKAKGWMLSRKKCVKNDDLWRRLDELTAAHKISWQWLRGHAGQPENERCDALAQTEIAKIKAQFTAEQLAELVEEFKKSRSPDRNQALLFDEYIATAQMQRPAGPVNKRVSGQS